MATRDLGPATRTPQDVARWGDFVFNVRAYGAKGDGTTDDGAAIQAAITAAQNAGGGIVLIPPTAAGYVYATGLVITPAASKVMVWAYGAKLTYTGVGDGLLVNTNIGASDVQNGERTVHTFGLHIVGTSSAQCGIRNYGCSRASFTDTTLDGFTSTTSGRAALILDARFHYWVEECHFDGLEIKNAGNGILFVSRDDESGVAASCMNNTFTAVGIWITQASGKGMYGIGIGASGLVQIARSVFTSVVVHPVSAAGIIAFDLSACYVEGTVFLAPGIDIFGTCATLTGFKYSGSNVLSLIGPTAFPLAGIASFFLGGGRYVVLGGNAPSTFFVDPYGNVVAPTLTLLYDIYDANGNSWIKQIPTPSAVNRVAIGNAAAGGDPWVTPDGSDANIDLQLYGKGSGKVYLDGSIPATVAMVGPQSAPLTYASTIAVSNPPHRAVLSVTLTGTTAALGSPSGTFADGHQFQTRVRQDATGGRLLTFGAGYGFSDSIPSPTLSTGAGKTDTLAWQWDAAKSLWILMAMHRGS